MSLRALVETMKSLHNSAHSESCWDLVRHQTTSNKSKIRIYCSHISPDASTVQKQLNMLNAKNKSNSTPDTPTLKKNNKQQHKIPNKNMNSESDATRIAGGLWGATPQECRVGRNPPGCGVSGGRSPPGYYLYITSIHRPVWGHQVCEACPPSHSKLHRPEAKMPLLVSR
jgi:hypothetical protein